ncbi:tape measure protein [Microvirga lenta]|uniref:tape measure protein n=1 Tax=Microvirga lenta TaxID=2881337 RepID=UPI001CFF9BCA|nr:tape measure protein [Microvirga lenta]MCB5176788.1 tape measure protein [Microvirga lenta]
MRGKRELVEMATRSRSELAGTVDLYSTLQRATQELGVSQQQVSRVVETVTKSFQLNGGSAAGAAGAIMQLGQAFDSGVLRGEEFNSVLEQAPSLARLIAQEFGVGMGDLRKLAEDGKISAERVFQAIENGSADIDAQFAKTASTMAQESTNAGTALLQLGAEMDGLLGVSDMLAGAFQGVANAARGMASAVSAFGDGREVLRIQGAEQAVRQYEMNVAGFQGRNDYASRQDLAREMAALENARRELSQLQEKRLQSMITLPDLIRLNEEGMVTTERTIRATERAVNDLAEAEKKLAREGMTPVARAMAEAEEAHKTRLKTYEELRAGGAEQARINDLIARSEQMKQRAIAQANAKAVKGGRGGRGGRRGSGERLDDYDRAVDRLERQNDRQDLQADAYGKTASEVARLRVEQELLTAAQQAGRAITPEMALQIEQLGMSAASAAQRMEELRERSRMSQEFEGMAGDALKGVISDLRQGKDAAEAMTNALDRLADRLIDMALDSALSGLFGKGGINLSSFFGGGRATIANFDPITGAVLHEGGTVGIDGTPRIVHPAHFENAPRFHNGTLAHDERYAILQTGEKVLSRDDVATSRSIGAAMSQPVQSGPRIIINNNGPTEASAVEHPDGSIEVIVDALEGRMADRASRGKGPLYKASTARAGNRMLRG